ncbi:Holliday junction resolvase RuvX [bacterium]|nr:Holliday junction resolvase RuvX [bacterium]
MSRIICIDYGRKKIGIAVSDPLGITAQPFDTWYNLKIVQVIEKLKILSKELEISKIVIGLPLTMKGEKGKMASEAERFASMIRKSLNLDVVMWDERLSSRQAIRTLQAMDKKPSRDKKKIDKIAATIILQSYLAYLEQTGSK